MKTNQSNASGLLSLVIDFFLSVNSLILVLPARESHIYLRGHELIAMVWNKNKLRSDALKSLFFKTSLLIIATSLCNYFIARPLEAHKKMIRMKKGNSLIELLRTNDNRHATFWWRVCNLAGRYCFILRDHKQVQRGRYVFLWTACFDPNPKIFNLI